MNKITHISNELKEWLLKTLHSGVKPEQLVDALINKGFDPKFSYTLLFQMIRNQSIETIDGEQTIYQNEIPSIGQKGNLIHTSDRDIKVTMRLDHPFIMYLDNFLSNEECDDLIQLSKQRLHQSQVIDSVTGERTTAPGRTSEGTEYAINESPLIRVIEKKDRRNNGFPCGEWRKSTSFTL